MPDSSASRRTGILFGGIFRRVSPARICFRCKDGVVLEQKMNEMLYISAIDGVTVQENLYDAISVGNGSFVTDQFGMIQNLLDDEWREQLGDFEQTRFRRAGLYIFGRWNGNEEEPDPYRLLSKWMYWNQRWLMNLWLIRDNAGSLSNGYSRSTTSPRLVIRPHFTYTDAGGMTFTGQSVLFTKEELEEAAGMLRFWKLEESEASMKVVLKSADKRLARADEFLQRARMTEEIEIKIAMYCTCLESLFTTSNHELRHQLSERVTLFLGQNPTERLEIYSMMKTVYDVRSAVVHGGEVKEKYKGKTTADISKMCDQYVRQVFGKLYTELSGKLPSDLDSFFLEKIFGTKTHGD